MTVPQYAHLLGTILGELAAWHEFARHGSASGFLPRNGHSRSLRWQSEGLYPSIQYADIREEAIAFLHSFKLEKALKEQIGFGVVQLGHNGTSLFVGMHFITLSC